MHGSFEQQPEIVRLPGLDKLIGPGTLPVVDTTLPSISYMSDHTMILRDYMPARYQFNSAERGAAVTILNDIAQLDKRVPIPISLKAITAEILKPGLIEQVQSIIVGIAVLSTSLKERDMTKPTRC